MATLLDKRYQRYAKDILTALIEEPSGSGMAAGIYMPYRRFEMSFPEEDVPEPVGRYTDLVSGKISPKEFHKGSEIHEMAYGVAEALNQVFQGQGITAEAVVDPVREGVGYTAQFILYSEAHKTQNELGDYLKANRQKLLTRLSGISDDKSGDLPGHS